MGAMMDISTGGADPHVYTRPPNQINSTGLESVGVAGPKELEVDQTLSTLTVSGSRW